MNKKKYMKYKKEYSETARFFLQLVRYGINADSGNIDLPKKPDNVEWKDIFILSKKHSLTAVIYPYIKKVNKIEPDLISEWEREYNFCICVDTEQLFALDEIKTFFSKKEIPILPLKGVLLKKLYPDTVMRLMGDIDILYDTDFFEKMKEGMEELGYKIEKEDLDKHDKCFKRPLMTNVEMHCFLLPKQSPFFDYYINVWDKALPTDISHIYRFSKEDEYIFMLIHAYKHFYGKGSGVRTVVDFYLFLEKYNAKLDLSYINAEINKADSIAHKRNTNGTSISEFNNIIKRQTEYWFKSDDIIIDKTGLFIISNGVYGRIENSWKNDIKKTGRIKYLLKRLFPPLATMRKLYTVLVKAPILLPVCWFLRLIHAIFCSRKKVIREFHFVRNKDKY